MRAKFPEDILARADGQEMTSIMRSCVHCGFCNATCPTYQIKGDELDGPRGRIYLIKSMLETSTATSETQLHLDRCLTCRACETTCPSGVQYARLVELARPLVDEKAPRGLVDKTQRWLLRQIVPYPRRFALLVGIGNLFKPVLPRALREMIPATSALSPNAAKAMTGGREMILLAGCAQSAIAPSINAAAQDVFGALGIKLSEPTAQGCCGAVSYHLGAVEEARGFARRNIDAWTQALQGGAEAVVSTSSGCSMMLKEYAELLSDDPDYAERAHRVSELVRDPGELIEAHELARHYKLENTERIAFHPPCTLQHGLGAQSNTEACLRAVGFELAPIEDAHLCCGSAGSYSLLQPKLANQLLDNKLRALNAGDPTTVASSNIGCLMHLQKRADRPVMHWLEMIRPHRVGPEKRSN